MTYARSPSHRLTFEDAVALWKLYISKHYVQRIAAHFDCNIGRVYEVVRGILHPGSKDRAALELDRENPVLAAALRAFVFKPPKAANDNQLELFGDE